MGIRQAINENPAITAAATGGIIVIALIFIIVQALPHHPKAGPPGKLYFTDDDGKSYFPDEATKIPPFTDKDGKEAVLAFVYRCGENGTPFVGYMLKYTADGQKRMQDALSQPNGHMMDVPPTAFNDTLVKKPGEGDWVGRSDNNGQDYTKDTTVTCPDGTNSNVYPVLPNMQ